MGGSSPLARGAHVEVECHRRDRGHIPARAGSTTRQARPRGSAAAHPRSRGERKRGENGQQGEQGSSPLARGAHGRGGAQVRQDRLIPARAGSTTPSSTHARRRRAHPRSRGEHTSRSNVTVATAGSSPLARGARPDELLLGRGEGLIPARAGSTPARLRKQLVTRAHPRSRGEHTGRHFKRLVEVGSSPLARGALQRMVTLRCRAGLIPARAGSTSTATATLLGDVGSSPLARGARTRQARPTATPGLIPARAGSTARTTTTCPSWTAHPRSRGEHIASTSGLEPDAGSSPLARGALGEVEGDPRLVRLIPARAGSTMILAFSQVRASAHPRSRGEHLRARGLPGV